MKMQKELEDINCGKPDEGVRVHIPWVKKQIQERKRRDTERTK